MPRPLLDPAPWLPHVLPVRLLRPSPPVVSSFVMGVAFTGLGAGLWWLGQRFLQKEPTLWPLHLFCVMFLIIGLLFLFSASYQFRRMLLPPTVVELSSQSLDRRRPFQIALLQPGPVKWRSLSVWLVCVDRHTSIAQRADGEACEKVKDRMLHKMLLIGAKATHTKRGDVWHEQRECTLPDDARASTRTRDHEVDLRGVCWTLEVRGKGPFFGGFLHHYPVRVV